MKTIHNLGSSNTINSSNQHLYLYHTEIDAMKNSIHFYFNRSKINEFYKNNGIRINGILNKLKELEAKFITRDEAGNILFEEIEGVGKRPIMVEGTTYEQYVQEYNDFMKIKAPFVV